MNAHQPPPAVEAIGRLEMYAVTLDRAVIGPGGSKDDLIERAEDIRLVLESLRHSVEREAGLLDLIERFVRDDDDARKNPLGGLSLGGLMDSRDNHGVVYQSQHLADTLASSRAALDRRAGT